MLSRTRIAACLVVIGGVVTACASVIGIGQPSLDTDEGGTLPAEASIPEASPPKDAGPQDVAVDTAQPPVTCTEDKSERFGGHCYFVLPGGNQPAAKAACVAAGAHLVTITTEPEQMFVKRYASNRRWIGLQAPSPSLTRADYKWITKEVSTYLHWQSDQPNADGSCVALDGENGNDEWVDRHCLSSYEALCERE